MTVPTREQVLKMWEASEKGEYGESIAAQIERFAALAYTAGQADERKACIEDARTVGGIFAVECEACIHARNEKEQSK